MIAWAVETLLASTMLMLLVLAIRAPVRRAFGPAIAYALWALPVLRMVLPPMPQGWRGEALPTLPATAQDITLYLGEPVATLPAAPVDGMGWPSVAIMLWVVGTLVFLSYHLIAHSRFCARLRHRARRSSAVAGGTVEMIESDAAAGPLAFGIWRKYVAFPADFGERYDEQERDLALAHELAHHARGDLVANWVALVVLAFHWFNPIAWRAFRAFRADQEMACDSLVLSGRPQGLRHAYGRAIVKSAHGGAVSAACHLHTINEIKGRLRMLTKHQRPSRQRWLAGITATLALTTGGLAATASSTAAAGELRAEMETRMGMPLDAIELPVPPVPPVPSVWQEAPTPAPPAPPAPPVPSLPAQAPLPPADMPVPPTPPVPPVPGEHGDLHVQRVTKDGKSIVIRGIKPVNPEWLERKLAEIHSNAPDVREGKCGKGEGFVLNEGGEGGKKRVVRICTDRIEAHAADVGKHAANAKRMAIVSAEMGKRSALAGLNMARRSIEAERSLSDDQRREALAGIDQALAELRSTERDD